MKQVAIKTDCGAAMCFIGHTLALEGYKMRLKVQAVPFYEKDAACRSDYEFISPTGRRVTNPFQRARRLLGFNDDMAHRLFEDYNIRNPKQAAKRIQKIIETGKV